MTHNIIAIIKGKFSRTNIIGHSYQITQFSVKMAHYAIQPPEGHEEINYFV